MATGSQSKKQARGPAGVQMHGAPIQVRGGTSIASQPNPVPTGVKKVSKRGNRR
jgi:hypothetical protein